MHRQRVALSFMPTVPDDPMTTSTSPTLHPTTPAATDSYPTLLGIAIEKIAVNDYTAAIKILESAPRDNTTRNTLGVCLMRAGCIRDAIGVFRGFALIPGSVVFHSDTSDTCKRNFATCMLLLGSPSGALDILDETSDHETIVETRLRVAILNWAKTLSWWRRLDWVVSRIEPAGCCVPIDFEIGEFDFEVVCKQPPTPPRKAIGLAA
jgi:hypothetical protein